MNGVYGTNPRRPRGVSIISEPPRMEVSHPRIQYYTLAFAVLWTVMIGVSLFLDVQGHQREILTLAYSEAKATYNKDIIYRRWNSNSGGVYVPVTAKTQPNPYLSNVPERDIRTPSGRLLTLVNPAYMTRQVHELGRDQYGFLGHLTSLQPLRPENAPDAWEAEALRALDRKRGTELKAVEEIRGERYLRVMYPIITETTCLRCHGKQGYKQGDIRGGLSYSIPVSFYEGLSSSHIKSDLMSRGILWVLGLAGIGLGGWRTTGHIRKREQAEEAARRSLEIVESEKSKSEAVIAGIGDAISIQDRDYTIIYQNQVSKNMVGAHMGETCYRAYHHKDRVCDGCVLEQSLLDGQVHAAESSFEANGRTFHVESTSSPLKDASGNIVGGIELIRDITDRKRGEQEKDKLQAQLQHAMKMEAVGRLAGGVAHDFNNLLTVITGYSELLLQKIGKESPMHGEVEEIKRAGERAASLTQQLLAFSRKQIIEPKVLDLNLLMDNLGKMLVRLIGENIHLKMVPGKDLERVKVDPGQFEQVLVNLAVNARDAMPDGGTLVIETANVELGEEYCAQRLYAIHPGRFVRLAVSDTGPGMTEETSKRIFEPFFTTKAKGKGTGLGLSMIYGAIKQSGGSIEVYSEVGKGTTFKIYLPRVEGEAAKLEKDDRPAVLPGGTETVLVTEDDDTVRNLCVQILERIGYKVLQTRNGAETIALAQGYGDRIDLLLTDVVLPGMNGSELATQLGLLHPEMKVLFASGYTDDAIVRHGVLDEGVSFIGKPYTTLALARKVREVLDKA